MALDLGRSVTSKDLEPNVDANDGERGKRGVTDKHTMRQMRDRSEQKAKPLFGAARRRCSQALELYL